MSDCSTEPRRRVAKVVRVGNVAVFPDAKADKEQALKVLEEAAEVVEAWKAYDRMRAAGDAMGMPRHEIVMGTRDDLLDEVADVIQAACNMAAALGVRDFTDRMHECRKRNEARGRM